MGFLGVYRAVYDYVPQGESELAITEGDILYVLEKSGDDDWWKAKKKASGDDDDEPIGLIPNNYIEEARPNHHARALYDYARQTDEELSFPEDSQLEVFDTSDPDWILVGLDGEYGFAPANYIEVQEAAPPTPARPTAAKRIESDDGPDEPQGPAAALANVIQGRKASAPAAPPPATGLPARPQYTPEASDEDDAPTPVLPARPQSQLAPSREPDYNGSRSPVSQGVVASPSYNRVTFRADDDEFHQSPSGFRMYNINEMVSVMGKRKKMPTTLGINLATGIITIAPEKSRDGPQQEWTAEKMTHHSIEGKHIFMELVRPSKSVDFHAGSKDTAHEIISTLGELAGAMKAEGLREVLQAGLGQEQKTGIVLYDFMAQGDDEVSVAIDDEVIIIDNSKSEEWWQVRRLKNGKEGVVPSSYVEITGTVAHTSSSGLNAGRSTVEQNRLEEHRLAKESLKAARMEDNSRGSEVGPGMHLPERGSSLQADLSNTTGQQKNKRDKQQEPTTSRTSKAKPDPSKVRTWTDRSKSFSVEAQFLALKDGKINLHKMNGVKIAVPVAKMSIADLEYVEQMTGVSLDEDKPLSEIKRQQARNSVGERSSSPAQQTIGASIQPKESDYDWFTFFLSCDVAVGLCERYAQVFNRDSMDESILPDIDANVLRRLGMREGDNLKVMKFLDNKFGRTGGKRGASEGEVEGGLFSGPGGALKNNTRKGRPAPAVQTSDVVDPKAFSQQSTGDSITRPFPEPAATPTTSSNKKGGNGFDDDAWDVKPSKPQANEAPSQAPRTTAAPPPQQPTLIGSMHDLSLLDTPLEPTKAQPTAPPPAQTQPAQQQPPSQQVPQQSGATPSFFSGVNQQPANGLAMQNPQFIPQQTGYNQAQPLQQNIARQRPMAPQFTQNQGSLMPPPPARPLSAPQSAQQSTFGPPPLQPQMTGMPNQIGFQPSVLAPPGQSLAELNQLRLQQYNQQQQQQQQQQMQPQMTGFMGQQPNNMMMPQPTGFGQQNGFGQMQLQQTGYSQPQFMNGQMQSSPFGDPRGQQFSPVPQQPTGFQGFSPQQQFPQPSGVNNFLPPALQPAKTGMQPLHNGFGQGGFGQPLPPMPPMPQQQTIAPLIPQKTGPPPPVRFGVTGDTKKLMPQATGRRANLAQATPQNPFGF